MKDTIYVFFSFSEMEAEIEEEYINRIGRDRIIREYRDGRRYEVKLSHRDELAFALDLWASLGLNRAHINYRIDRNYDRDELYSARLLRLTIRTAPKGLGGAAYGTDYDLAHACSRCGTGARQTSRLIVRLSDMPKRANIMSTMHGEILITERVVNELIDAGLPESLFWQVEYREVNKVNPRWFQIVPSITLSKMAQESKGIVIERQCKLCYRDRHFMTSKVPLYIKYLKSNCEEELLKSPIYSTWECFGNSVLRPQLSKSNFAHPLLLINNLVFRAIQGISLRGVEYAPVNLID